MPKKIRYRRTDLIVPDNISMNKVKKLINSGGDYGLTVQQILTIFGEDISNKEVEVDRSHAEWERIRGTGLGNYPIN